MYIIYHKRQKQRIRKYLTKNKGFFELFQVFYIIIKTIY